MKSLPNSLKNWIDTDRSDFIRTLLLSEGFGFCFFLCLICGRCLDRFGSASKYLIPGIGLSLLCGSVLAAVMMCMWTWRRSKAQATVGATGEDPPEAACDAGRNSRIQVRSVTVSPKIWLIASLGILLAWIPVWLAYYPAVFAYDAEAQLGQVISQTYSTHHPLLHTLILGACMNLMWDVGGIEAGMVLYAVLQMLFLAAVLGWIIAEAYRLGTRRWLLCLYGAFCAFFPVNPVLAISTTKDVVFSGLVPVFVLLMRRYLCEGSDKKSYLQMIPVATFMVLFRNNALYALVSVMIVMTIGIIAKHRSMSGSPRTASGVTDDSRIPFRPVVAILIGCIAGCLISGGMKAALHASMGSPREAMAVPIQQMARVYVLHADEIPADSAETLAEVMNGSSDELSSRYNEHLADPVKRDISLDDPAGFVKTWIGLGLRWPGDYLDAWLYTSEGAWYIGDTSVNRIYGEGRASGFGYLSTDTRSMPPGFEVIPHSHLPGVRNAMESLVSDNAFEKVPLIRFLFAPALYVWILAAYAYVSIVRCDRVTGTILLYPMMVFLTILLGPAVLVRYMYPFMLLVILPMIPASHAGAHPVHTDGTHSG
ncbi:MAG: hypothetical protein IJS12_01030 [Lachnospiraceae bacterium]|nr:hypothetical protein [Lachnospiraceae bacterium]